MTREERRALVLRVRAVSARAESVIEAAAGPLASRRELVELAASVAALASVVGELVERAS